MYMNIAAMHVCCGIVIFAFFNCYSAFGMVKPQVRTIWDLQQFFSCAQCPTAHPPHRGTE